MRLRVRRLPILAIALTAVISFPLGVIASHQFSDVPTSSTYHADIDAIADAGVTTGCAAGKYCPKDFVTREQMAAFLNRLGALQAGKTPVVNATRLDGLNSTQFVRNDVQVQGQSTCAGGVMTPAISNMTYSTVGTLIYATGADLIVRCQFQLPDGASITGFQAVIRDGSNIEHAACRLERLLKTDNDIFEFALVQTSDPATPGDVTLTSSSGLPLIVDNGTSTYTARCSITGSGDDIGILSASIEFTFTGLPIE